MGGEALDPRRAWRVVEDFERALCEYTGSKYAVAVDSCTNALYLCFVRARWSSNGLIWLPRYTYVGVARAAINAGLTPKFSEAEWVGEYHIGVGTHTITDAARWLRRGMHSPCAWATCISFQASKHLPIGRGGAILCDDEEDAMWFRRARHDGRAPGEDLFKMTTFQWGIHCYMPPPDAARGLWLMASLPDENEPLPGSFPDISKVKFE